MTRLILILSLMVGCKDSTNLSNKKSTSSNKVENIELTQDSTEISKLPYSFKYNYENPTIERLTIEEFFNKNRDNIANNFFRRQQIYRKIH